MGSTVIQGSVSGGAGAVKASGATGRPWAVAEWDRLIALWRANRPGASWAMAELSLRRVAPTLAKAADAARRKVAAVPVVKSAATGGRPTMPAGAGPGWLLTADGRRAVAMIDAELWADMEAAWG